VLFLLLLLLSVYLSLSFYDFLFIVMLLSFRTVSATSLRLTRDQLLQSTALRPGSFKLDKPLSSHQIASIRTSYEVPTLILQYTTYSCTCTKFSACTYVLASVADCGRLQEFIKFFHRQGKGLPLSLMRETSGKLLRILDLAEKDTAHLMDLYATLTTPSPPTPSYLHPIEPETPAPADEADPEDVHVHPSVPLCFMPSLSRFLSTDGPISCATTQ
jgi:hypothetical protein